MHRALLVKKALCSGQAKHALVPDVRMNIQAATAVKPETDKVRRLDVVTGQCERHEKRFFIQRKKQLAAVRMVVGVP